MWVKNLLTIQIRVFEGRKKRKKKMMNITLKIVVQKTVLY